MRASKQVDVWSKMQSGRVLTAADRALLAQQRKPDATDECRLFREDNLADLSP